MPTSHASYPRVSADSSVDSLTRLSRRVLDGTGPLAALLRDEGLHPVFQPIASLESGVIFSHEALIRGPSARRCSGLMRC